MRLVDGRARLSESYPRAAEALPEPSRSTNLHLSLPMPAFSLALAQPLLATQRAAAPQRQQYRVAAPATKQRRALAVRAAAQGNGSSQSSPVIGASSQQHAIKESRGQGWITVGSSLAAATAACHRRCVPPPLRARYCGADPARSAFTFPALITGVG